MVVVVVVSRQADRSAASARLKMWTATKEKKWTVRIRVGVCWVQAKVQDLIGVLNVLKDSLMIRTSTSLNALLRS